MAGTATSPNIILKSRRREGVGRRREGVARELGDREEKVQRHAGRRRGVNARKSSGTLAVDVEVDKDKSSGALAVDVEVDEDKSSGRWPSRMTSTNQSPADAGRQR